MNPLFYQIIMTRYTPGTKLSYDGERGKEACIVLTDGNVHLTKVWGEDRWQQMKLADWLILAEGLEVEEYIPLPKEPLTHVKDFKIPRQITVEDKFKWILSDDTYRVAVQTNKGFLEVKSVIDGNRDLKKTMFPCFLDWALSLPEGGCIKGESWRSYE
jgi:hypothetical protein